MSNYIEFVKLELLTIGPTKNLLPYFSDMLVFFRDVTDPTDLNYLASRPNPDEQLRALHERTAKYSGAGDRHETQSGNTIYIEEGSVMGGTYE